MCTCTARIGQTTDLKQGETGIPLDGVMKESLSSLLPWAWCINEDKVKAAFKSKTGLDISDSDLVTLIRAHAIGNDVKSYKVNFLDVVKGIRFTQAERDTASCKVMLVRK